jgi:hypothetical protein
LFIRKTLASALTSLEKNLAYNSSDKNLGKEVKIWEKKQKLNIVDLQCLKKKASVIQDQLEAQLVAVRSVALSKRRLQMLVKVRRRRRVLLG